MTLDRVNISREHCEIVAADGGHTVRDLDSRNGTYLNGQRITAPTPLADGAVIQLGDFALVFRQDAGATDAPATQPATGPACRSSPLG